MITFSKSDTLSIKGLAIILMLAHHIFAFPDRINVNLHPISFVNFQNMELNMYIGIFGKICVSIFMFLGGLGTYRAYKDGKFDLMRKILSLYYRYWKIFIIFIPVGFIFFSNQINYAIENGISNRFSEFNLIEFISNLIGISCSYNGEWWFLWSYIIVLCTFPIFLKIIDENNFYFNVLIIIIINILVQYIFPTIPRLEIFSSLSGSFLYNNLFCQASPFMACFYMGMLFGKEFYMEKFIIKLKNLGLLNTIIDIIVIILIMVIRTSILGSDLDIFYVPIIIVFSIDLINKNDMIKSMLCVLGRHSTNMWFIHSFLCYYFYPFQKIIMFPKYPILILMWFIIITLSFAIIIERFYITIHLFLRSFDIIH